jgi:hypothetical protein
MKYVLLKIPLFILLAVIVPLYFTICYASNIDPLKDVSQYAYGENIGWLNFEPSQGDGVTVTDTTVDGFVWGENIGWINLGPMAYGGVVNDGSGILSGFAWGENVGWINFNPTYGGISIDVNGNFYGWAWGENIGWIQFNSTAPFAYKVQTEWTPSPTLITLASFIAIPRDLSVMLKWSTASETETIGFNLYRSQSNNGNYTKINSSLIPAKGSPTQGGTYEFIDANVQNRKTYYYKLEDIDLNGNSTMHGSVHATPRLVYRINN